MSDLIYYCTQENNICHKKETCIRYLDAESNHNTTLFNLACTDKNDYVLYLEVEQKGDNEEQKGDCNNEQS